jgi:hypothetical protein
MWNNGQFYSKHLLTKYLFSFSDLVIGENGKNHKFLLRETRCYKVEYRERDGDCPFVRIIDGFPDIAERGARIVLDYIRNALDDSLHDAYISGCD